jgi:hypothetical protein
LGGGEANRRGSKKGKEDSATVPSVASGRARAREADDAMTARILRVTPPIVEAIEAGNFPRTAALAAGVPVRTWNQWKQWAEQGVPPCAELFEAVSCALARAEMALVAKLANPPMDAHGKADQGWIKATTTILERVHREQWGERVEVRVKVEDSMRELLDELEARMPPESFQDFVIALSEIGADDGDDRV